MRLGLCRLPEGVCRAALYGVSLLAGIGFTMSPALGTLAFEDSARSAGVRLGLLAAPGRLAGRRAGVGGCLAARPGR